MARRRGGKRGRKGAVRTTMTDHLTKMGGRKRGRKRSR